MVYLMPRGRNTKIVATLGPVSHTKRMIRSLYINGVDMFRLNFSHINASSDPNRYNNFHRIVGVIRQLEDEFESPIGILGDLQGPKLRVGAFKDKKIALRKGMKIRFDLDPTPGDETRVQFPHPKVLEALEVGHTVKMDDGNVEAKVVDTGADWAVLKIMSGKVLSNRKGVNVPGVTLPVKAFTDKDHLDLQAALDMGMPWLAQSFAQTPADVAQAVGLIQGRANLMVKLETLSALEYLDDHLVPMADGFMVARGDLSVEIPYEQIPAEQRRIVATLRDRGKPVVVATQMLESMIDKAKPTNAEVTDVNNAVRGGTGAVMLSAETAAGVDPVGAVRAMHKIIRETEREWDYHNVLDSMPLSVLNGAAGAAVAAAKDNTKRFNNAAAIFVFSGSGDTARLMARQRPSVPIISLTFNKAAHGLTPSYGVNVVPIDGPEYMHGKTSTEVACEIAVQRGFAKPGEVIIVTEGEPYLKEGSTNTTRTITVPDLAA